MNIWSRVIKLEKDSMPPVPSSPLLILEDAPDLDQQIAEAKQQGRTVIVVSDVDANL